MEKTVLGLLLIFALVKSQPNGTQYNLWDILQAMEEKCEESVHTYGCKCDQLCAQYGDCCANSEYFKPEEQRLGASRFTCSNIFNVYLISTCPKDWKHLNILTRCENPDLTYRDPLYDVPVTSYRTNITYRNSYCALCNNDFDVELDEIWTVNFQCSGSELYMLSINSTFMLERLTYNDNRLSWVLNLTGVDIPTRIPFLIPLLTPYSEDYEEDDTMEDDENDHEEKLYTCSVMPMTPEILLNTLRYCKINIISKCAENWTDSTVRDMCEAYTAHICFQAETYRNSYCVMCNNVDSQEEYKCNTILRKYAHAGSVPLTFSALLDWRAIKSNTNPCKNTQTFDPFTKTCRDIPTFEEVRSNNVTKEFQSCIKTAIKPEEYDLDYENMSVTVPSHNRTYQYSEYFIGNNSTLYICAQDKQTDEDSVLQYVTVVGLALSIMFLVLHLIIHFSVPKLQNLSSMNLASLCVSLLILYATFVTSWFLKPGNSPCFVVSVFVHYSLLAVFNWMLIIAFDIWRALRQATTRLRVMTGPQRWRFGMYSVWGWLLPAVIVAAALTTDFCSQNSRFSPGYGVSNCWFRNSDALLLYVVVPLAIVMACNVIFFCWSAFLIFSTTADTVNTSSTHTDFRLYTRLASIMGLTWLTGLIAGYVNWTGMWYVFVILNTLQGLFIFIAFTCTKKVWREITKVTKYPLKTKQQSSLSAEQSTMTTRTTAFSESKR